MKKIHFAHGDITIGNWLLQPYNLTLTAIVDDTKYKAIIYICIWRENNETYIDIRLLPTYDGTQKQIGNFTLICRNDHMLRPRCRSFSSVGKHCHFQ